MLVVDYASIAIVAASFWLVGGFRGRRAGVLKPTAKTEG